MNTCQNCGQALGDDAPKGLCPACLMKIGLGVGTATSSTGDSSGAAQTGFVPPSVEELGRRFIQFEVLELIGRGGMGAVYKARQKTLDRLVALKILSKTREQDPAFAERFVREAKTLARLNHPNIVAVYDFGEASGLCYLVMEYVDGLNLRQLLQTERIPPKEALAIVPDICAALQYAHNQGVVHRDIKPENVLLDKDGRVKIADFGIAKLLGPGVAQRSLTREQQVIGTPHYMAPEQVEKPSSVDHRADIYSLGVVFYEMLTGELPLGKFAPPSARIRGMQIDVRLDEVVLRALEKEPERRYQQASQMKTEVETITTASKVKTAPAVSHSVAEEIPPDKTANNAMAIWLAARQTVRWPALGLMVTGLLSPFLPGILLITGRLKPGAWMLWPFIYVLACTVLIGYGALKMKRLESYRCALLGAIAGIGVSFFNLLCLPFSIWALAVLTRPQIKSAFALRPSASASMAANRPTPPSPAGDQSGVNDPGQILVKRRGAARIWAMGVLLCLLLIGALWLAPWIWNQWQTAVNQFAVPQRPLSPGYEKAIPSNPDLAVQVGPNRFVLQTVIRNERDGRLLIENGRGNTMTPEVPGAFTNLAKPARWLDLANVYFGVQSGHPESQLLYDIIEVRVFNHATRQLLDTSGGRWGVGWELIDQGVLQLRSAGSPLPDKVDIWFRANSHADTQDRLLLRPAPGTTTKLGQGLLAIRQMLDGQVGYHQQGIQINWFEKPLDPIGSTFVLDWSGIRNLGKYQICVMDNNGQRHFPSAPHFIDFQNPAATQVVHTDLPLNQVAYLELRPFSGRHTFFFEGVQLPRTSGRPLDWPPPIRFKLDGQELALASSDLDPLEVRLTALRGQTEKYSSDALRSPDLNRDHFIQVNGPLLQTNEFATFLCRVDGLQPARVALGFLDYSGEALPPSARPRNTMRQSQPPGLQIARVMPLSLDQIATVAVQLGADTVTELEANPPPAQRPLPSLANRQVESLDLSNCQIDDEDLWPLQDFKNLKRLDLTDTPVTDDSLRIIKHIPQLESLYLAATLRSSAFKPRITDAGLAHLSQLKTLRTLSLHGNNITDAGLAHLQSLPFLQRLQLGGTQVTGPALGGLTKLEWIRLDATPITDEGLRYLTNLIRLDSLYLDQTSISDGGLEHLRGLQHLRVLNLHETDVTSAGVARLKKALPAVNIGFDNAVAKAAPSKIVRPPSGDKSALKAVALEPETILRRYATAVWETLPAQLADLDIKEAPDKIAPLAAAIAAREIVPHHELIVRHVLDQLPKGKPVDPTQWTVRLTKSAFPEPPMEMARCFWHPVAAATMYRQPVMIEALGAEQLGKWMLLNTYAPGPAVWIDGGINQPVLATPFGQNLFVLHLQLTNQSTYRCTKLEWLQRQTNTAQDYFLTPPNATGAQQLLCDFHRAVWTQLESQLEAMSIRQIQQAIGPIADQFFTNQQDLFLTEAQRVLARLPSAEPIDRSSYHPRWPQNKLGDLFAIADFQEVLASPLGLGLLGDPVKTAQIARSAALSKMERPEVIGRYSLIQGFAGTTLDTVVDRNPMRPILVTPLGDELVIIELRRTASGAYTVDRLEWLKRKPSKSAASKTRDLE